MLKIIVQLFIIAVLVSSATPLLKTGQTKSYDENGKFVENRDFFEDDPVLKDDGYYQSGAIRNYIRSDEGVVKDTITGLEWQDDESAKRQWLTSDNSNKCYRDKNMSACYDTSGETATTYCSALSLDGGGWRLPSIYELETIVDYAKSEPSVTEGVFEYISSDSYWSSTSNADCPHCAWYINFEEGYATFVYGKAQDFYVRCVRGGQ